MYFETEEVFIHSINDICDLYYRPHVH